MKAVITSVGEPTTALCIKLMERYGFKVEVMDQKIPWFDKFCLFVKTYDEDVVRIDADVLPLPDVQKLKDWPTRAWIVQTDAVDLYSWDKKPSTPMLYRQKGLEEIRKHLDIIDHKRPEATAWRLINVNPRTEYNHLITGLHGFFQRPEDNTRALKHRNQRGQPYDTEVVEAINLLCNQTFPLKT